MTLVALAEMGLGFELVEIMTGLSLLAGGSTGPGYGLLHFDLIKLSK